MTMLFRAGAELFAAVRQDLHRPHPFAAERVGFLACRAARLAGNGLIILATTYEPVADEDYLEDHTVGAMMGPAAIRKAMQRAYNSALGDISIFHVHMHECSGHPGFSRTDLTESAKFVPVSPRLQIEVGRRAF